MKMDLWTRIALWAIAVMLVLNFVHGVFVARPAQAVSDAEEVGRYQITSWAAYTGGVTHHSGYYILDTVTGKVTDRLAEVHSRGE
jgi:hypothetical protein